MAPGIVGNFSSAPVRALISHDPAPDFDAMECPTLVINGGADTRRVSPESRPKLLEAFEADSTSKLRLVTLGGLGHFLESAEQPQDAKTFADEVPAIIIEWLDARSAHAEQSRS